MKYFHVLFFLLLEFGAPNYANPHGTTPVEPIKVYESPKSLANVYEYLQDAYRSLSCKCLVEKTAVKIPDTTCIQPADRLYSETLNMCRFIKDTIMDPRPTPVTTEMTTTVTRTNNVTSTTATPKTILTTEKTKTKSPDSTKSTSPTPKQTSTTEETTSTLTFSTTTSPKTKKSTTPTPKHASTTEKTTSTLTFSTTTSPKSRKSTTPTPKHASTTEKTTSTLTFSTTTSPKSRKSTTPTPKHTSTTQKITTHVRPDEIETTNTGSTNTTTSTTKVSSTTEITIKVLGSEKTKTTQSESTEPTTQSVKDTSVSTIHETATAKTNNPVNNNITNSGSTEAPTKQTKNPNITAKPRTSKTGGAKTKAPEQTTEKTVPTTQETEISTINPMSKLAAVSKEQDKKGTSSSKIWWAAMGCFLLGVIVTIIVKMIYNKYRKKSYVLPPEQNEV